MDIISRVQHLFFLHTFLSQNSVQRLSTASSQGSALWYIDKYNKTKGIFTVTEDRHSRTMLLRYLIFYR